MAGAFSVGGSDEQLRKRGVIEQYSQSYVLNDIRALEREVRH